MNLEEYRKKIYSNKTESNLRSELLLLDALYQHQSGKYLSDGQEKEFWKLVAWIVDTKPGLNELSEEVIGERFHVRKYEKKDILKDLIFYEVGNKYSEKSATTNLVDLAFFSEHMGHGFYLSYAIKKDVLKNIVDGIDGKNEGFLNQCRSMNDRGADFVSYCKQELSDEKSEDELIKMMNLYNSGDYTELPLGVDNLSYFLLRDGHYDLYARLLAGLYYFPLQGGMLCWLHSVDQGFAIWEELEKLNPERIKVIEYLLRKRILELLSDEPEMLDRNAQNEYIGEKDRQVGKDQLEEWNNRVDELACYLVDLSIKRFGVGETSVWYSRHRAQLSGRDPKFVKYKLTSLEYVEKCLESRLMLTKELIEEKELNTLLYYAQVASTSDSLDKEFYQALVAAICEHVYSDRYVQSLKLDEMSFQTMRNVYRCLLKGDVDGIQVLATSRQSSYGRRDDYSLEFRQAMGDSVWLPILLLQTEETEDATYFIKIVKILTKLVNYDKSMFNDYYFMSFYLAELIVIQVLKEKKDKYEGYLINRVPNLYFVLRILTANDGQMNENNKKFLRERVAMEWEYEKKLSQQYKEQTNVLEEYLKKTLK